VILFAAPQESASQQTDYDSYKFKSGGAGILPGSGNGVLREAS